MNDWIVDTVEGAMGSPWVFAALFAFAAIDGFFPLMPSESLVITAGVFAATGAPDLAPVIASAAAGAFAGDHVAYAIGRGAGSRRRSRKQARLFTWAEGMLDRRGGMILVVCRYIPGARTAITMTAGAVAYPLRRFSPFDALAAVSWAAYSALVGYVGGAAFEDDPIRGLVLGLGLGLALAVAALVELVRHTRRRHMAAAR